MTDVRAYTRILFSLNALYQLAVGAIFLFLPAQAINLYHFPASEAHSIAARVAIRALGANLLLGGGISAVVGRDPDRHPALLIVMGALAVLTLLCWGLTLAVGETAVGQVAADLGVQVLLLVAVAGYYGTAARNSQGTCRSQPALEK